MHIKYSLVMVVAIVLLGMTGAASAASIYANTDSGALSPYQHHSLPVLVQVNSQGKITSMAPAYELRPKFRRMLHKSLNAMITAPAHDKDGQAISSQFVIYLAAKTTPRADGKFNLQFVYVKAMPVPAGSWYWGHFNGRKLALISQGSMLPHRQHYRHWPRHHYRVYRGNHATRRQPNVAPTQHRAPPPSTTRFGGRAPHAVQLVRPAGK